jgi:hypothetical protein
MPFSPWALRPALSTLREQGHRPIAWAVAREQSPASLTLLRAALIAVPGLGPALGVLAGAALGPRPRLILLCDRALHLFAETRPPGGVSVARLEHSVPIEHLRVHAGALGISFALTLDPARPPRAFAIDPNHSACADRLCRALTLLAASPQPTRTDLPRQNGPGADPGHEIHGPARWPTRPGPAVS